MLHCLVSSDWHLEGMAKVLKDPIPYQLREIEKVYQYALSNGIKHIFVPGDLTHTPNMSEDTLVALLALLLKYDGYISTYYTLGNHDVLSIKKSSLDLLSTIAEAGFFKSFYVFKSPTIKTIEGIDVAFLPFPHLKYPTTKRPPLVFCHIETAGCIGDNGRPMKTGVDDQLSRQKGDFLISGHIHQHQYIKSKRILYVGSLYQTNFGESLPKGFLDVRAKYSDTKLKVTYEQINSKPNFILETKTIESNEDWEDISEETNVRYKVLVEEGLVVPKNISQQLKNIISITGVKKSKVEMEGVIEKVTSATDLPTFSLNAGLKEYLKASGCDKEVIKRAKSLVKDAISTLGLY